MLDPALGPSGTFLSPAMMHGRLEHLLSSPAEPGFQLLSAGLKITSSSSGLKLGPDKINISAAISEGHSIHLRLGSTRRLQQETSSNAVLRVWLWVCAFGAVSPLIPSNQHPLAERRAHGPLPHSPARWPIKDREDAVTGDAVAGPRRSRTGPAGATAHGQVPCAHPDPRTCPVLQLPGSLALVRQTIN